MVDSETSSPLSFAGFLDKMKEPASSDLVRSIKLFIKRFEDRPPNYSPNSEADSNLVQDFLLKSEQAFRSHPAWHGCGPEVLEQAVEGLEKYVMSKIWRQTFGCSREDKDRDERYSRLATALGFVQLDTLAGLPVAADPSLLAMAQGELLKMDRYKAPRDKLLCLVNVKTLVEEVVTVAARAGAGAFGGADAFFPVFLLVVIRSRPPRLASNIEYIRRFRSRPRLHGQFDFMLCNLESAAMYLDTVDYKHLHISQDEFLTRLSEAGIPEAEMELRNLKLAATATTGVEAIKQDPASGTLFDNNAALTTASTGDNNSITTPNKSEENFMTSSLTPTTVLRHQDNTTTASTRTRTTPNPELDSLSLGLTPLAALATTPQLLRPLINGEPAVVEGLVRQGAPLVLEEEAQGTLQARHPFVYASPGDLSVADVRAVLAAYRQLVFKYEAVVLAVKQQESQYQQQQEQQVIYSSSDFSFPGDPQQQQPPSTPAATATAAQGASSTQLSDNGNGVKSQPESNIAKITNTEVTDQLIDVETQAKELIDNKDTGNASTMILDTPIALEPPNEASPSPLPPPPLSNNDTTSLLDL